jgi:DNA repair exonuclease SbcCD ATPase subunit
MENRRIAKFFIATLTGEQIEEIAMVPQEYTYHTRAKKKKEDPAEEQKEDEWEILSAIRFDFIATIRTESGEHKKVLIEIQKTSNPANLMRFRTYLGEQYKRIDMVEIASGKVEKSLPIISIYLLGFKLPNIEAPAVKIGRIYTDIIGKKEIKEKSEWIEALTHDGYFVQIPYVTGKPRTLLEKLLSIFEQEYFVDEKKTMKEYEYPIDNDNLKTMLEELKHAAADTQTRREMEEVWWAEKRETEWERSLQESRKIIEESRKALKVKDKTIEAKDQALEENKRTLEENKKTLEENKKALEENKKVLEEKDQTLEAKEKEIAELRRLLGK